MKHDVVSIDNKVVGSVDLKKEIFGLEVRQDILHRVVNWQLDKARQGTHSTKGISEISGTTKKPFAQKGTGRARQGSLRSPQMRGGAIIFGPKSRDHGYDLTKKFRALGLKMALSSKMADKNIIILESEKLKTNKTKDLVKLLNGLNLKSALFVGDKGFDENFKNAITNVKHMDIIPAIGLNVYDILHHNTLVLTKDGLSAVEKRFDK
ncbi:MAG: 50S ribosomal protein L4 [Rickettsiales bacterium]|jgi:large subunit ribosomal protein L4|nr:50S ribosomal protein L4 [Rickettsiales bacterium]